VTAGQDRRRQEAQVQVLLGRADAALLVGHLGGVGEDNAVAYLRAVLKLAPDHPEARSRLTKVLGGYAEQGRKALAANDLEEAEQRLKEAQALAAELHLSPESLTQLTWDIAQKKVEQVREGRMQALLAKADKALAAGRLDQPQGNNALDPLREALKLMPDDARARRRIDQLLDAYARRIREGLAHNDLVGARQGLRQAQAVATELHVASPRSLTALDTTLSSIEAQRARTAAEAERRQSAARQAQERKQQIDHLLARADQAVAAGHLVRPKDNNAADLYRQALGLSAGDERVLQLLDELLDTLVAKGREALDGGDLGQARAQLQDGQALAQELRLSTATLDRLAKAIDVRAKPPPAPESKGESKAAAVEQQIQALVEKGEDAVDHNWLTFPQERSAAEYVRQIFQIAPGHPEGKKLAGSILDRYLAFARRYLARENPDKASTYLERAAAVAKEFDLVPEGVRVLQDQIAAQVKEQERQQAEARAQAQAAKQAATKLEAKVEKTPEPAPAAHKKGQERERQQVREEFAKLILQGEQAVERKSYDAAQTYLSRARRLAGKHDLPTDGLARLESSLRDRDQAQVRVSRLIDQGAKAVSHQELAQARNHLAEARRLAAQHYLSTNDLDRLDTRIKEAEGQSRAPKEEKKSFRFIGTF